MEKWLPFDESKWKKRGEDYEAYKKKLGGILLEYALVEAILDCEAWSSIKKSRHL